MVSPLKTKNAGDSAAMAPKAGNGGRLAMPWPVSPDHTKRTSVASVVGGAVVKEATPATARRPRSLTITR
jgi:hypothetical protein